jgi:putative ABC transport system permease protein
VRLLISLRTRLCTLFHLPEADRELDEEFRYHLDRQVAENRAAGMSAADARSAALRAIGGIAQFEEECRDARGTRWLAAALQDLRYGVQLMRRSPGFAAAAVLTIAIGIAAATSIFSVVYSVLLQPLPYRDPSRLVALWTAAPRYDLPRAYVGAANYLDWKTQSRTLEDVALIRHIGHFNLTAEGEPEHLSGARVTANLFPILGVQPELGRAFDRDNEREGAHYIVVISDRLWRRRFGADPAIVGRAVRLNGEPYTIGGVMPPSFRYPGAEFDLWAPLVIPKDEIQQRLSYSYLAVARLKRGVSVAQAQADLDTISARLEAAYPQNQGIRGMLGPLREDTVGDVRTALWALLGAVICVLLIGAVNVANLFLARGISRARDRSLRAALGASRARLALQAVSESLPIVSVGALCGVGGAFFALRLIVAAMPASMPRLDEVRISAPVLAFSGAVLLLTAALVAFWPALQSARTGIAQTLRFAERSNSGGRAALAAREFLIVAEVALTVVLVAGSCLLARSFAAVRSVDPGFHPGNALSVHLAIPRSKYPKDRDVAAYMARLLDRVRETPGVVAAGMVNRLPIAGGSQSGAIEFEGVNGPAGKVGNADWRTITPDYLRAIAIPLIEGRTFTEFDGDTAKNVGLIDVDTARRVWPHQTPLGKRFRIAVEGQPWVEIVGVVGRIRHDGLDADAVRTQAYWNYRQRTQDRMALVVRTAGDPGPWMPRVIAAIRAVDPDQPVYEAFTMDQVIDRSLSQRRVDAALVALFAGVSLLLAIIGIYGVMSYAVEQRVREFGIRMALGARPGDVVRQVVRRGTAIGLTGAAIGLAATLAVSRLVQTLLYGVSPKDWVSYTAAAAILIAVAALASYLPVRRAVALDPMQSLRNE